MEIRETRQLVGNCTSVPIPVGLCPILSKNPWPGRDGEPFLLGVDWLGVAHCWSWKFEKHKYLQRFSPTGLKQVLMLVSIPLITFTELVEISNKDGFHITIISPFTHIERNSQVAFECRQTSQHSYRLLVVARVVFCKGQATPNRSDLRMPSPLQQREGGHTHWPRKNWADRSFYKNCMS